MATSLTERPSWLSRIRTALSVVSLRSPFWNRSVKHRMVRLILHLGYAYLVILVVLLWLENWLLFRSSDASEWAPPPRTCAVDEVWLTSSDGTAIHAWWVRESRWEPKDGAMLFCHGNGGNLSFRGDYARFWVLHQHLAVLLFDYPGYGKSGGRATEAGCYAAADAAYDWLTGEQKVPAERLILYGGSLGGAVAVDVASRRPHRALILVSTFTSFPDMAQHLYPFLPAHWLVRNRFDSVNKITQSSWSGVRDAQRHRQSDPVRNGSTLVRGRQRAESVRPNARPRA